MANEVKMWRHIGIGMVVSFFALTLTTLSFGNNIYSQLSNLVRDSRQMEIRLLSAELQTKQAQAEVTALRAGLEKQIRANAPGPLLPKAQRPAQMKGKTNP